MSSKRFVAAPDAAMSTKDVASQDRHLNLKRKPESEVTPIFQGRDESYPDELNKLILPLCCQLCKSQMTSLKSAKDHYESKVHDRHISAWLAKNYTECGLQTPPVKRMLRKPVGSTGPNAYHCELCDLPLTSLMHARQHYAGRKHQLVEQKRSRPSGAGYYNDQGKWVRTSSRVDDGELLLQAPPDSTTTEAEKQGHMDGSLSCRICQISVTSASQIQMHREGAKHQRNLRKHQLDEEQELSNVYADSCQQFSASPRQAVDGELSMYRTPSGSYYCKMCNKAMNHISILQQHLLGKKHLKATRQYVGN